MSNKIQELKDKYKLTKDDFWDCHGNDIISHNAVEKIMSIEKIGIDKIKVLNSEIDFCRLIVVVSCYDAPNDQSKKVMTIGEASKDNCKNKYYGAMAEKRGIDRAVLKLINAYEYGIYSDVEADDFKKGGLSNKEKLIVELREYGPKLVNEAKDSFDPPIKGLITDMSEDKLIAIKNKIKEVS